MSTQIIIVVPCYNEACRLDGETFRRFIRDFHDIGLLFVNDGSSDNTADVLAAVEKENSSQVSILHLPQNRGKAEAVRQGILHALQQRCRYIGYWDADLATPLSAVPQFVDCFTHNHTRKIICGARVQRMGAHIHRHWYRHYPGRIIATIISLILGLPFYDTQCGAKLMERSLAEKIASTPFISSWLFDVEVIARIVNAYGKQQAAELIFELPLDSWADIGASKVSLGYLPKIPYELFLIYRTYRKTNTSQSR